MEEKRLTQSLTDSIKDNIIPTAGEYLEILANSLVINESLKQIPLVSTMYSVYKIGNGIHEAHQIKMLYEFLMDLNNNLATEEKKQYFRAKMLMDKDSEKIVTYLLIILDKCYESEKAKMISKMLLAYIDEKIDINKLFVFSQIVERFLTGDYDRLKSIKEIEMQGNSNIEPILRLLALGLLIEDVTSLDISQNGGTLTIDDTKAKKSIRKYRRTRDGELFVSIIEGTKFEYSEDGVKDSTQGKIKVKTLDYEAIEEDI